MNLTQIIKGIKNIKKEKQPINKGFEFDKELPITQHNFPLSKITEWYAFGYKIINGKKVYDWITKRVPTGHPFIPDLDKVLQIKSKQIF